MFKEYLEIGFDEGTIPRMVSIKNPQEKLPRYRPTGRTRDHFLKWRWSRLRRRVLWPLYREKTFKSHLQWYTSGNIWHGSPMRQFQRLSRRDHPRLSIVLTRTTLPAVRRIRMVIGRAWLSPMKFAQRITIRGKRWSTLWKSTHARLECQWWKLSQHSIRQGLERPKRLVQSALREFPGVHDSEGDGLAKVAVEKIEKIFIWNFRTGR